MRGRLRRHDLLARLGGDEFLVAVAGLDPATAAQEAARVAGDLADAVAAPVLVRDELVSIGASVGISVYPNDGEEFAALLHEADLKMYALKVSRTRA
jgi:diguanylate cyclase (GGDEF)-like protein